MLQIVTAGKVWYGSYVVDMLVTLSYWKYDWIDEMVAVRYIPNKVSRHVSQNTLLTFVAPAIFLIPCKVVLFMKSLVFMLIM